MDRALQRISLRTAGLGFAIMLAACGPRAASAPGTPSKVAKNPPAVNTGLSALASNAEAVVLPPPDPTAPMSDAQKAAWAQQSALNLEQLLREGAVDDFGRPTAKSQPAPTPAPARPVPQPQRPDSTASAGLGALAAEAGLTTPQQDTAPSVLEAPVVQAAPPPDPVADLAARMATLLRPAPGSTKPALADASALIPIEAMKPGVLATLDSPENPLAQSLAPADLESLRQARTRLLADAATPPDLRTALRGSEAPMSAPVPAPAAATPAPKPFSITRAALCTRVQGYGRFDPYSSTTFVAGRSIRAIVYTELDGFATRPARSGDPLQTNVAMSEQVSVQLSQTLTLYHDKDGLLAWHRPPQGVTETSRSARRDFYLIQIIELPSTLSIGRYNLKVTVTDTTTGAEAERIIPVDIVADPGLVSRGR